MQNCLCTLQLNVCICLIWREILSYGNTWMCKVKGNYYNPLQKNPGLLFNLQLGTLNFHIMTKGARLRVIITYSVCLTITLKKENRFIHDNKSLKCSYECRIKLYSFIHYLLVKSSFQG